MNIYQHGEIMLVPVETELKGAKQVKSHIVAHSETGHHHVLESNVAFDIVEAAETIIRLSEEADLVHKKSHDKHETKVIQPGTYRVIRAFEYDPFQEVIKKVAD